jgi:hypothetical protein
MRAIAKKLADEPTGPFSGKTNVKSNPAASTRGSLTGAMNKLAPSESIFLDAPADGQVAPNAGNGAKAPAAQLRW